MKSLDKAAMAPCKSLDVVSYDTGHCGLGGYPKGADVIDVDYLGAQNGIISTIDANANIIADSEEVPPIEVLHEYRNLRSQENYWKNKHNDLSQAFKILSAYDIDVDYTELILLTREAARNRKELASKTEQIETKYPIIPRYDDIVFDKEIDHDPILDRAWSSLERKKYSFDDYSFISNRSSKYNNSKSYFTMQGTTPAPKKNYIVKLKEEDLINAHKIAHM